MRGRLRRIVNIPVPAGADAGLEMVRECFHSNTRLPHFRIHFFQTAVNLGPKTGDRIVQIASLSPDTQVLIDALVQLIESLLRIGAFDLVFCFFNFPLQSRSLLADIS